MRAEDAVIILIVNIFIPGQVPLLRHRAFIGQRRDSPAVEDLFADPGRFVARVGGDDLHFGIVLDQTLKHSVKGDAVVDIAGRDLRFQHIAPPVADRMRLVGEAFPVLALLKYAAVWIGRRFRHRFLPGRRTAIVVILLFQGLFPMRRSIRFDLRVQLLLIPLRRDGNLLLHALLQVRVRLDVRSVHKHDLRRQIPRPGHFLQYPAEYAFDHFRRKAMAERIADRRKVRKTLRHRVPQKPAIRHVHFCVPHGLPQRSDPEQMLDQHQLEQHHRIAAWPAVVLAV